MTDKVENQVATELLEGATPEERAALSKWASTLLGIRDSSDDGFGKARSAFIATVDSTTAWPLIRRIGDAIKRNAWDERSTTERAGVGAATADGRAVRRYLRGADRARHRQSARRCGSCSAAATASRSSWCRGAATRRSSSAMVH